MLTDIGNHIFGCDGVTAMKMRHPDRDPRGRPERMADSVITVAGMTLLLTPLLLWIAPSKISFYLVLSVCGLSFLTVFVLTRLFPGNQGANGDKGFKVILSEDLVAELQKRGEVSRRPLDNVKAFIRRRVDD